MTTQNGITKIMESMGWTDGSFIPIANEENRQLMAAMEELQHRKENTIVVQQDLVQRTSKFSESLAVTKKDITHNLKLLEAHRSQLSDEHHLFKVAEYEDGTLTKKLRELRNNASDLEKFDITTQDEMKKSYDTLSKLSNKIKWSKTALDEWQQAMQRGEGNNQMIAKYCKEDAVAADHLEAKRRTLQMTLIKQRQVLIDINEEQRSLESILDRTAQLYRQAHQERRNLVNTWKEAVLSLRSRDKEIAHNSKEISKSRLISAKKSKELKEHEDFLERQLENNKEVERQISDLNDKSATIRQHLTDITHNLALQLNDLITVKKLSQSVTNQLQQRRSANRLAAKDLLAKEEAVENMKTTLSAIQKKFERFKDKNWNATERLNSLDEMVQTEEKNLSKINAENNRLSGALFRLSKMLVELRDDHKTQEMEIQSIETDIRAEKITFKDLEVDLVRQTEIIYHVELKTTLMESRIAKMQGFAIIVDPEVYTRLQEMEKEVEDKTAKRDLVKKQILKIEDDMRLLTNTYGNATSELDALKSRLQSKRLEYEGGVKEHAIITVSNQEHLVDLSVLKMRVHQLDQMLNEQKDKVFNLQRHQANLELAMNERMVEIKARKETLWQRRKHLDEELTQLRADIGERALKIQAIQARYDNASAMLGRNEDGSFVTATQIKIETAQEKQMLLRDGNELNERVIRAEKDIEAIENTLVLLNYSNNTYKKSLEPIKEDNKELCDLNEMTDNYSKVHGEIKKKKEEIKQKNIQLQELNSKESVVEKEHEYLRKIRLENNDQLMKLHKEILEQKSKMERAKRELKLARKTAKQKLDDVDYFAAYEKELKLKELETGNNAALQQLADMVDMTTAMGPVVSKHLFAKGLTIPQPTKCRSNMSQRNSSEGSVGSKWSPRISQFSLGFEPDSATSHTMTIQSTPRQAELLTPAIVSLDFGLDGQPDASSRSSLTSTTRSKQVNCSRNAKLKP